MLRMCWVALHSSDWIYQQEEVAMFAMAVNNGASHCLLGRGGVRLQQAVCIATRRPDPGVSLHACADPKPPVPWLI